MATKTAKTTKKTTSIKTAKKSVKTATKKPALKGTAKKISRKQNTKFIVSHEQRRHMINEAAYFLSLKRDYTASDSVSNWFEAEKNIDLICECKLG